MEEEKKIPDNFNGENKRLHLQMIEGIINRMGNNSFLIKGWSLTSIGGLITLFIANHEKQWAYYLLFVALGACLVFWRNDATFLYYERQHRKLYNEVCKLTEDKINFSMQLPENNESIWTCCGRPVYLWSYGVITIVLIVMLYIFKPC